MIIYRGLYKIYDKKLDKYIYKWAATKAKSIESAKKKINDKIYRLGYSLIEEVKFEIICRKEHNT